MKMGHVTIRTRYFEEEIAFYRDIAELKVVRDLRERGSDIVFLADTSDGTRIEVIRTDEASKSGNRFLSIGFHTDDVENLRSALMEKGMEVSQITSPSPAVRFFFVTDPAGVSVQFLKEEAV